MGRRIVMPTVNGKRVPDEFERRLIDAIEARIRQYEDALEDADRIERQFYGGFINELKQILATVVVA